MIYFYALHNNLISSSHSYVRWYSKPACRTPQFSGSDCPDLYSVGCTERCSPRKTLNILWKKRLLGTTRRTPFSSRRTVNIGVACSSHASGTTKIKGLDRKPRCCQQPFPLRGNEMATCLQISLLYVICRRSGLSPGALGQDFFPIYEKGVWGPNLLHAFFCLTSLRERPDCGYPGVGWGAKHSTPWSARIRGRGHFQAPYVASPISLHNLEKPLCRNRLPAYG